MTRCGQSGILPHARRQWQRRRRRRQRIPAGPKQQPSIHRRISSSAHADLLRRRRLHAVAAFTTVVTSLIAAVVVTDSVASAPLEFRITQSVSAQFVDGKPSGQRRLGFARSFGHAHRRAHRGQGGRRRLPQTVALCRRQSKPDAQFRSSQVGQRFRPAQQQRAQPPAQQFGSADSV